MEFIQSGPDVFGKKSGPYACDPKVAAINLSSILNKLIELGVKFGAILPKLFKIYAIVTGPGTWLEKAKQIFDLFSVPFDDNQPVIVKG